ncbi:Pentatricopeptide repeat-containing protein [Platanthera guangdongensis]|uniref:Pentatricopeptide repeat-containing protein n=1 Tax=Platanthera guangdongensis TaxID=2320717 RepID=A0ABR2MW61_9ASPA
MRPNEYGFSIILNACTGSHDLVRGRIVHGYLTRLGYESDRFTANALLDFYAKWEISNPPSWFSNRFIILI